MAHGSIVVAPLSCRTSQPADRCDTVAACSVFNPERPVPVIMADTLLYLVYGQETYVREARYSLLSAFAQAADSDAAIRHVVYTDRPDDFSDIDVEVVPIDAATQAEWRGAEDYPFRVKMCVQRDALSRFGGKVAFIDTDTYFRANPALIFARISPGRSVMHVAEGRLGEIASIDFAALRAVVGEHVFFDQGGMPVLIDGEAMMWNSGVVGLDSTDARLLDEAIAMIDQMCRIPAARAVNQIEQFATGIYLSHNTSVSEAMDVVFHYWPHDIKAAFRTRLPQILADSRSDDAREWGRRALIAQPVTSPLRRSKMHLRTALRRAGLRVPGLRTSV